MENKLLNKLYWFTGGFGVGLTLLSIGHAAVSPVTNLPKTPALSEIKAGKVAGPDLDDDYSKLTNEEAKYAESWAQQEKIRAATQRASQTQVHVKKKSKQ